MKYFLSFFLIAGLALASCQTNKYATTTSTYESDDVYYQPSDTYISDFALVDDEAQLDPNTVSPSQVDAAPGTGDDYYDGNSSGTTNGTTNNYYGDVYQSPWSNNYGNSCGFGAYNYGSYSNFWRPQYSIGYNPYTGWYTSFSFGYNWGYSPYYSPYYGAGYGWYSPYYNPWYYNQWGYNTWYSPYNYYNPYYGYNNPYYGGYYNGNYWNDGTANLTFGHRNPIATGSVDNSTYGDDVFYSGRVSKPTVGSQPNVAVSQPQIVPSTLSHVDSPSVNHAEKPSDQTSGIVSTRPANRPTVTQATDNSVHADKPGTTGSDNTSVFKPQVSTNRPRPTYTTEPSKQIPSTSSPIVHDNQPDYFDGRGQKPSNPSTSSPQPVYNNPRPVIPSQNNTAPERTPQVRPEPQKQVPQHRPNIDTTPSRSPIPSGGGDRGGKSPQPARSTPSVGHTPSGGGQHNSGGSISGPRRK